MVRRITARLVVAGLLPGLLGACYTYRLVPSSEIQPATRVSVVLSDYGRLEASRQIGPQAARVEGAVVSTNDTAYPNWPGIQNIAPGFQIGVLASRFSNGNHTVEVRVITSDHTVTALGRRTITIDNTINQTPFGNLDIPLIPGANGDPGDQ